MYSELLETLREEIKHQLTEIEANGDWFWAHPETGYKEWETQKHCVEIMKHHGFDVVTYPGVTGFVCRYDTGKPGPNVGIMAEMDSVVCFEHPDCNPQTGAAHACGHSIQMAVAMGAFFSLKESGALAQLSGSVTLLFVPAEECVETEWRLDEIKKGKLHYLGGKQEFLYRGAFQNVDVVISMHSGALNDGTIRPVGRHNGFLSKNVTFKGCSSHAAVAPEKGINALYMANTALTALNALRETFRDEDMVRVHPILTKGGEISNAIPEETCIEAMCRANNLKAELDAAEKFDRAMGAGAYAFGGKACIKTLPGYLPYQPTKELDEVALEVANDILGAGYGLRGEDIAGSEDMGDLSTLLPIIQVYVNYMQGMHHSADYRIADRRIYEISALFLAALTCKLLDNNGELAQKVITAHKPQFSSVEEYCAFMDQLFSEKYLP